MTVRDAVNVLKSAKQIALGYDGNVVPFDKDSSLMMDACGGYVVEEVAYFDDGCYVIYLAVKPFKEV